MLNRAGAAAVTANSRAIGRSRPAHTPTLAQLLTSHEQEVVELAITGATTREMATELLVSPKTVESLSSHERVQKARCPIKNAMGSRPQPPLGSTRIGHVLCISSVAPA